MTWLDLLIISQIL